MGLRSFTTLLLHAATMAAVMGLLLGSIPVLAVSSLVAAASYAARDYARPRPDSMTVMSVYALIYGAWMSLGNAFGYFLIDSEYHDVFFNYAQMEYLFEAQVLATLAVFVPVLSYPLFERRATKGGAFFDLPRVGFATSDGVALRICIGLVMLGVVAKGLEVVFSLGVFGVFVAAGTEIAIFLIAWNWLGPKRTFPRWTLYLLAVALVYETLLALMFAKMRGQMIYPFFMIVLAFLMRKALTAPRAAAVALVLVAFSPIYTKMGALRQEAVYGTKRMAALFDTSGAAGVGSADDEFSFDRSLLALVSRFSQFDQLSQVVSVADTDGLYWGETLSYMTYVFIPRVIWPDKPLIAPGQWFAERIGKGQRLEAQGTFSNSINMTVPGEFYLNFGWLGAVVGLLLITYLFALFWQSAQMHMPGNNPVGVIFGLALLRQTTESSSAAAFVHLILIYLMMLSVSWAVKTLVSRSAAGLAGGPVRAPELLAGAGYPPRLRLTEVDARNASPSERKA